jgi:hypothetical protein
MGGTILFLVPLFSVSLVHLICAPYTKVEESFHTQAFHDMLFKLPAEGEVNSVIKSYFDVYAHLFPGLAPLECPDISRDSSTVANDDLNGSQKDPPPRGMATGCAIKSTFDHLSYPGVVPRSFLPAIVISSAVRPIKFSLDIVLTSSPGKFFYQCLSRAVLGFLTCLSLSSLGSSLPLSSASKVAFVLICVTQPHLLYYSSRPLPNTFALVLSTFAFSNWFRGRSLTCIFLLIVAVCTCRCDILVLAAPVGLSMLAMRQVSFVMGAVTGLAAVAVSLAVVVPLDTVMWDNYSKPNSGGLDRFLWAEGVVLFYNTVENKSSDWGTSPWWWYFGSALPKALAAGAVFAVLSVVKVNLNGKDAKVRSWDRVGAAGGGSLRRFRWSAIKILIQLYRISSHRLPPPRSSSFQSTLCSCLTQPQR